MRKLLTLLLCGVLFSNISNAQYVNLPDSNFRNILKNKYPSCFDANNMMDTTCTEIVSETYLNCENNPILCTYMDFKGIEYFKNLRYFNCNRNCSDLSTIAFPPSLETLLCSYNQAGPAFFPSGLKLLECNGCNYSLLPPLPATLLSLACMENQLSMLPAALPDGLKALYCDQNILTVLPALPDSLEILYCGANQLTALPALPVHLNTLECYSNHIAALPELPLQLNFLGARYNQLVNLPVLPASLNFLDVFSNNITSLPVLPNALTQLNCAGNSLSALPQLPSSLVLLNCSFNQLTSLPALSAALNILRCESNLLSELPALPLNISQLTCNQNKIYCLPTLPFTNNSFDIIMDDKIKCIPNLPPNIYFTLSDEFGNLVNNSLPPQICNPANNINQCSSYPVITGTVFFDNNSNGVQDSNEPAHKRSMVKQAADNYTFTNNVGYFEIATIDTGIYHLSVNSPVYFNSLPANYSYHFTSYDTLAANNFALQANAVVESLQLTINPINWAARPGFPFPYMISYENTGTTTVSPNIVFNYDNTRLVYDSSSNAAVTDNGSSLSLNVGSFVPGQQGNFIAYFKVKPTAVIGDTLNVNAVLSANSNYSTSSTVTIRGAFDPNDKQATPQLSPSQVASGKYIDYTIRFQNTGNDTAFNIVITDTLNNDLQSATMQMMASSHNCKATVKDNIVFFEFLNILLPDSNVNELKSHGFVSFRIKPQPTVAANTTIPNKAAIYFDYNAPVITNTAGTLIKDFTVIPLRLVSFTAVPQTDNTTTLYWNTANEINTRQFIIERGNDGLHFNALATVVAKGRMSNNYSSSVADVSNSIVYYRLKIVDNDGSFNYSPIIKIDRRKNSAGFAVLSNPVKDFIVINTNDRSLNNTSCNIINGQGAVVKSFIISQGSQAIDVKGLPNGIYYLRTVNGSSRVVIQ